MQIQEALFFPGIPPTSAVMKLYDSFRVFWVFAHKMHFVTDSIDHTSVLIKTRACFVAVFIFFDIPVSPKRLSSSKLRLAVFAIKLAELATLVSIYYCIIDGISVIDSYKVSFVRTSTL